MIVPVASGVVILGTAAACGYGVPIESGVQNGVRWRTRWACWRVKVDIQEPNKPWETVAVVGGAGKTARGMAKATAVNIAVSRGLQVASTSEPMVRIRAVRVGGQ